MMYSQALVSVSPCVLYHMMAGPHELCAVGRARAKPR